PTVFLSHDWGADGINHDRVRGLRDVLRKNGIVTWFDEDNLRADIVQGMINGIDAAHHVIVVVTLNYTNKCAREENDNCKLEFMHAYRTKSGNRLLPVIFDEAMRDQIQWTGPVGAILGHAKYFDLSPTGPTNAVESLCKTVVGTQ